MKAILHNFQIKLTKAQIRRIRAEWSSHSAAGAVMVMQPRAVGNTLFMESKDDINVAILAPEVGRAVKATLQGFKHL
jgi:hypothetical protein